MSNMGRVDEDFVVVWTQPGTSKARPRLTLVWGDPVEVLEYKDGWTKVRVLSYFEKPFVGYVKGKPPLREKGVLTLSMIDVQQGDGLVLETPGGKIMLIDGGDNVLFARHVAMRFLYRQSSAANPLEVDAILVTHGDADHFSGLRELQASEALPEGKAQKRIFLHPRRVFHNGLVKGPSKRGGKNVPERDLFGRAVDKDSERWILDVYDDWRRAPAAAMNSEFRAWKAVLDKWEARGPIQVRRVAHGMDAGDLFSFLREEGVGVEIQGPFAGEVIDPETGQAVPALPFLHEPAKSSVAHLGESTAGAKGLSASHTINGHSIALRLTYGNVRFNLTGDLNQESMARLLERVGADALQAEIVKVPHHGSHDFDFRALEAMRPVVAIISSGDEMARKEYIHPRATLMAAVGKTMRERTGIVLCTELAAFFGIKKGCYQAEELARYFRAHGDKSYTGAELAALLGGASDEKDRPASFYGFERLNFGVIHIRTDGERVLVFTHSGKAGLREAYRFRVFLKDGERRIEFSDKVVTRA